MSSTGSSEAVAAFLAELSEVSRRHGIIISGCGCHGSPFLRDMPAGDAGYMIEPATPYQDSGQVIWDSPSSFCRCGRRNDGDSSGLCYTCRLAG